MKSILISLMFISNFAVSAHPSVVFAVADGGGQGITSPDDYYNSDYRCSLPNDHALYIKADPYKDIRVSIRFYSSRANKVLEVLLQTKFAYEAHDAGVYSVEPFQDSSVAFVEINFTAHQAKVLDVSNKVISVCRYLIIPEDGLYP